MSGNTEYTAIGVHCRGALFDNILISDVIYIIISCYHLAIIEIRFRCECIDFFDCFKFDEYEDV